MAKRGGADRLTMVPAGAFGPDEAGVVFTVSELAGKTGVSVQSIHYYRRLGLLPEPVTTTANRYLYDERHVVALKAIRFLRDEGELSLAAIGEILPALLAGPDLVEGSETQRWSRTMAEYRQRSSASRPAARLLAAARCSFASQGYDTVNVEDICDQAGVAKGSFYRYYGSKYEIFLAAARSTVDVVGDELEEAPHPLSEQEAVDELAPLLAPMLPLYLEVLTRELRGEQTMDGVFAGITDGLVSRITPRLRSTGQSALAAARRVVERAMIGLLRPLAGTH
jgi:AcrR family transcriptional regulator